MGPGRRFMLFARRAGHDAELLEPTRRRAVRSSFQLPSKIASGNSAETT
jgi:hypothetical protein